MRAALSGLTPRGRALLAAGVTAFLLAALVDQEDIMRVGLLAASLPLLSAASVARTRFRLASSREVEPSRIPAGETARVHVALRNVSHLPTGLLMVEDHLPPSLGPRPRFVVDRLPAQSVRDVTYTVHADRRGRYAVGPLSVQLADPFGFCRLDRAFTGQRHLLVTPRVEPLPTVPLSGDWTGTGESRSRSIAAAGEDDVAVREYRHGDELRRVHWRATAKSGSLMVRREEQPWESRATVLLDDRVQGHVGEGASGSFERAVSAAASIALHLSHRGYAVRLVVNGREVSTSSALDGGPSDDPSGLLLDALAIAEPVRTSGIHSLTSAVRHANDGLLVLVLGEVDIQSADLLARARHGMGTTVAVGIDTRTWFTVAPPPSTSRPSGQQLDEAWELLHAAGWSVAPLGRGEMLGEVWSHVGFRAAPVVAPVVAPGMATGMATEVAGR